MATVLWLVSVLTMQAAAENVATFTGRNFIEYDIESGTTSTRKDKVTLRFKTVEAYGVLLYSCGMQGDFLLLELTRGKIVYKGNFGSTLEQSGTHHIITNERYNDNKWHTIVLLRENGTHVRLTVDHETRTHTSQLGFQQLNLDNSLYIGGFGDQQRGDRSCHDNNGKNNYVGCLGDVRFNSIDLLYGASEKFTLYKLHENTLFACPESRYNIIGFHQETSLLTIKRDILNRNELNYYAEFATFEPRGHLSTHVCTNGAVDLDVVDGKMLVTLSFLGLGARDAIQIEEPTRIDDGGWHNVSVVVRRQEGTVNLSVDSTSRLYKFQSHFNLETELGMFMSTIRFGGNTPVLPGLVVCFRSLKVDGRYVDATSDDVKESRQISNSCNIKDLCFPNPCKHGGKCNQDRGKFVCSCSGTEYSGALCEACIYKSTCEEISASGENRSGYYKICPNNERIFRVYCDMITYGRPATVLKHNMENDTRVGNGRLIGSDTFAFYTHSILYSVPKQSILDLLELSHNCRQYIRFDCYRSRLLFDVGRFKHVHFRGARWLSRDSEIQHYWGGARPDSLKCGCGETGSCARTASGEQKDCNCDVGDAKWRFDAGYLTDKRALPVTQIQFSKGRETNEDSFFTIGHFECFGTVPKPNTSQSPVEVTMNQAEIQPTEISNSMFFNSSWLHMRADFIGANDSRMVAVGAVTGSIEDLFSKPWLISIVAVGSVLCLLLVFFAFLLFRSHINQTLLKCFYGGQAQKPRIEVEDYNRYSTASEENSDWDIYRLSAAFPTSTPEPSYASDEVNTRVRTLEDVRSRSRFKRLSGWGSRTVSAPTVVGSLQQSRKSITDSNRNDQIVINGTITESGAAVSSVDDKVTDSKKGSPNASLRTLQSCETDPARSTTTTEDDNDSSCMSDESRNNAVRKASDASCYSNNATGARDSEKYGNKSPPALDASVGSRGSACPTSVTAFTSVVTSSSDGGIVKVNGVTLGPNQTHNNSFEPMRTYYLPINGCVHRQPLLGQPAPAPRTKTASRIAARRTSGPSDIYQHFAPPTIEEGAEECTEDDTQLAFRNTRNCTGSSGHHYDNQIYDNESPSSETRLLFDDPVSREECEREADAHIALLKRRVIEKATSQDDSN